MNREISLISEMAVQTADTAETIRRRYSGTCVETESGTVLHYTDAENGTPVTLRLLPDGAAIERDTTMGGTLRLTVAHETPLVYTMPEGHFRLSVETQGYEAVTNERGGRLFAHYRIKSHNETVSENFLRLTWLYTHHQD